MLFNSATFIIFFIVVLLFFPIVPKKARYLYLLAVSLIFYMGWSVKYILLIVTSIAITYVCGIYVGKVQSKTAKKVVIAVGTLSNLAILFFFKYYNFFMDSMNSIMGAIGLEPAGFYFDIMLPVGISFYTFQALGYMIDVYRGDIKAERNFFKYALFVSFFPQLVAGPIERSRNLLLQLDELPNRPLYSKENIVSGLITMMWGFFMKMVIADRIAVLVNTVYDSYWLFGFFGLSAATVGFAIQIYCDFASYSAIAIGASKMMGINLMQNFNVPYFSKSIKEFWRRWHISLSTWFRDYVYIPLGGSRVAKWRKNLNLMIVFLVSGLWHGANWTFVAWGGINGAYQVIGDALKPTKEKFFAKTKMRQDCFSFQFGKILITFALTCFAWIFFRAASIQDAFGIISRAVTNFDAWSFFNGGIYNLGLDRPEVNILLMSVGLMLILDFVQWKKGRTLDVTLQKQNLWFQWVVILVLFFAILIFGIYGPAFDAQQFIYFQF